MSHSFTSESNNTSRGSAKVAVFDLDGTITCKDTYVEFLLFCLKKRPLRILRGGELIVYLLAYKAGFRSNHWLKAKYLGTVAGGLGGVELETLCKEFCANTIKQNFKQKALAELDQLRSQGYILILATASFGFYVESLYAELNMHYLLCSKAALDANGKITGALEGKNCIGDEKAARLKTLIQTKNLNKVERAYSDDIVDLPLFEMAEQPIVVDPATKTADRARALGFTIVTWV